MKKLLKGPRSSLPFPREPSSEEKVVLRRFFEEKMTKLEMNPYEYYRDLNEYVLKWTFDSWDEVVKCLNQLISAIKSGKIYDIRDGKVELPCKVSVPWKTLGEAVKHCFALFVHDKEKKIWKGGINNLVQVLKDYKWGKFEVERDKALKIIVQSWKKKDDSRYDYLTKDQLATILEVSVDEIDKIDC